MPARASSSGWPPPASTRSKGHYNGPGEPRNNWYGWEREGRIEASGIALDFWDHYEDHLDRAVAAGCDGFRMSVEWARCEPAEGEWDDTAFDRYAAILDACHDRGLEPLVTLLHFTHPWFLGEEFWLTLDSPERYAAWVERAVDRLGSRVTNWVTLNEINILALADLRDARRLPARPLPAHLGEMRRCLDHLLAAHVLGYHEIHERRPDAVVATNTFTFSIYELDRLLNDILLARLHDIQRADLNAWLADRKVNATTPPFRARSWVPSGPWSKRLAPPSWVAAAAGRSPRAVRAPGPTQSPHVCTQDVTQLDYYVPEVQPHIRMPGHRTAGGRTTMPGNMLWDDQPDAQAFKAFIPPNVAPGRDLWIVENGLCNRVRNGRSYPRLDGYSRPRYLREYLRSMVEMIDAGVPIGSYYHWSLVDNYEWGSYEPRFGLYGVDRERGNRWLDSDSMGEDSAGTYRRIIEALRAGDRSILSR